MDSTAPVWRTLAGVVPSPRALAARLRSGLGPHPVPQSDLRTRGLLVEMNASEEHRGRLRSELPELAAVKDALSGSWPDLLVLAVNETPPTDADTFLMMPHVDRRYAAEGFAHAMPERTTVVVLDFPEDGVGGELVAFDAGRLRQYSPDSRLGARAAVERAGGQLLPPIPGTAYELAGHLPHAVLGYETNRGTPWRMVVVIAEFGAAGLSQIEWRRLG
ncbi:MAG TPA: hypothetical protein VKB38_21530 [Terracidiphilus sp.]|nr:hypothetical protein [Terracidiphilus sp.]